MCRGAADNRRGLKRRHRSNRFACNGLSPAVARDFRRLAVAPARLATAAGGGPPRQVPVSAPSRRRATHGDRHTARRGHSRRRTLCIAARSVARSAADGHRPAPAVPSHLLRVAGCGDGGYPACPPPTYRTRLVLADPGGGLLSPIPPFKVRGGGGGGCLRRGVVPRGTLTGGVAVKRAGHDRACRDTTPRFADVPWVHLLFPFGDRW